MAEELAGRSALVIGANGNIGNAIARALGDAGARLTIVSRDGEALERQRVALATAGVDCRAIAADVTDDSAVQRLVEQVAADGLDIAVNNAGTTHAPAPLHELALDDIDRVLAVTLRGVLVAMRAELAVLRDGGSIVNVASTAGLAGAPGMSAYVAAKHAVVGLTRTAALDYAGRGIRITAVAPGSIDSGGVASQPDETRERIGSFSPVGRLGRADEVAAAVRWLASPASSFTTGAVLTVDGGKLAGGA